MVDEKNVVEFIIFFFFFMQVVSAIYVFCYWKHIGVDPFYFLGLNDIIFAASEFVILFAALILFMMAYEYFSPVLMPAHTEGKKGAFLGAISFVVALLFFLMPALFLGGDSSFVTAGAAVGVTFLKYSSNFLFSSFKFLGLFGNGRIFHFCVFIVVTGFVLAPGFAISKASIDEDDGFKDSGFYVKLKECHECSYRFVGGLGEYVAAYDWHDDKMLFFHVMKLRISVKM